MNGPLLVTGGSGYLGRELLRRSPGAVGASRRALLELAAVDRGGILHVAGADSLSRYELARLLAPDPERVRSSSIAESRLSRPRNCALSSARARAVLRTRLRGAREVLAERLRPPP